MTNTMRRIRPDLWETRTEAPFPGLTTHAYLWTSPAGNLLFYNLVSENDFDAIADLGGVDHQYLSHLDEAGPMLARIAERFGAVLHAPEVEADHIGRHAPIGIPLTHRHIDANGVEVVPTPGHSKGSTSYVVRGAGGETYLFTGDTMFVAADGVWHTFAPPGRGDASELIDSLQLLRSIHPDIAISSAFGGGTAVHEVRGEIWDRCVQQAIDNTLVHQN